MGFEKLLRLRLRLGVRRHLLIAGRGLDSYGEIARGTAEAAREKLWSSGPEAAQFAVLLHNRWAMAVFTIYVAVVSWAIDIVAALLPRPIWRRVVISRHSIFPLRALVGLRWLRLYAAVVEPIEPPGYVAGEWISLAKLDGHTRKVLDEEEVRDGH